MSILVNGMEMPKECHTCPMSYCTFSGLEAVLACSELHKYVSDEEGCRDEECPITELKTPHGRLIDADALIKNANFYETEMETKEAPTVIEAEGI